MTSTDVLRRKECTRADYKTKMNIWPAERRDWVFIGTLTLLIMNYVDCIQNINFPTPSLSGKIILIPRVHLRGYPRRTHFLSVQTPRNGNIALKDNKIILDPSLVHSESSRPFQRDQPPGTHVIFHSGRNASYTQETQVHWRNGGTIYKKPFPHNWSSVSRHKHRNGLPVNILQETFQIRKDKNTSENRTEGQSNKNIFQTNSSGSISKRIQPVFRTIEVRKEFQNG
ncbi:uncharacterized protein LOC121377541 [Gigantopelta aegis]|uniref:uncharacterized protein LOC121377541 n=1 Tax=Gigantopelta aegis TaxID=1735272 RepID=UPI001B88DBE1|nr:uncharacterized protein LOC121377541 [Gigantopelta aegis]